MLSCRECQTDIATARTYKRLLLWIDVQTRSVIEIVQNFIHKFSVILSDFFSTLYMFMS